METFSEEGDGRGGLLSEKKSQYWAGQSEVGRSDSPGNEHARPAGNLKVAKELGAENVL